MKKIKLTVGLVTIVLSLGVLVGCGDKPNTSNDKVSADSVEKNYSNTKDSTDLSKDKSESDKTQHKNKEAVNKAEMENKEKTNSNDASKVDNSNSNKIKQESNISKQEEVSSSSKKKNSNDEDRLAKAKSEYLQRMKNVDNQSKKLDKEYESDKGSTQLGMNIISGKQAKLYDDELNQIYGYLKENLGKEKFKELEKSEMDWIKKKEGKIAEIRKQYEGGSITPLMVNSEVAKESKERCYYLINNYMK